MNIYVRMTYSLRLYAALLKVENIRGLSVGKKKKKQPVPQKLEHPNWPLIALAGVGLVLTAYLAITHWVGEPPLYCDEGSSCDIVQRSRWGTFLGLPTALWGFLAYASLLFIGLRVRDPGAQWKSAWTVALVGLIYSIYLMAISLFVIEAACVYCIISFTIMAAIFGVVIFQRPKELTKFNFRTFAGTTAIAALVLVGGMHLHYSSVLGPAAGPEDPYLKALSEHLTSRKVILYGAYW